MADRTAPHGPAQHVMYAFRDVVSVGGDGGFLVPGLEAEGTLWFRARGAVLEAAETVRSL